MTEDASIAAALRSAGMDVLQIDAGGVALPGYPYGFIGGASGVFRDKLYFIGDVTRHRDSEKIIAAAKRQNLTPVSLGDFPLSDLGRIIFIDSDI